MIFIFIQWDYFQINEDNFQISLHKGDVLYVKTHKYNQQNQFKLFKQLVLFTESIFNCLKLKTFQQSVMTGISD